VCVCVCKYVYIYIHVNVCLFFLRSMEPRRPTSLFYSPWPVSCYFGSLSVSPLVRSTQPRRVLSFSWLVSCDFLFFGVSSLRSTEPRRPTNMMHSPEPRGAERNSTEPRRHTSLLYSPWLVSRYLFSLSVSSGARSHVGLRACSTPPSRAARRGAARNYDGPRACSTRLDFFCFVFHFYVCLFSHRSTEPRRPTSMLRAPWLFSCYFLISFLSFFRSTEPRRPTSLLYSPEPRGSERSSTEPRRPASILRAPEPRGMADQRQKSSTEPNRPSSTSILRTPEPKGIVEHRQRNSTEPNRPTSLLHTEQRQRSSMEPNRPTSLLRTEQHQRSSKELNRPTSVLRTEQHQRSSK